MTRLSLAGWVLMMLPTGAARAELVCPESTATLGQVASGSVLTHRFTLFNRGSHPIEVTEVKPGCGCLRPRLDRPTIRPGEQTSLMLEINTLTQAPGPNLWRAVVHYRENKQPAELTLAVRHASVSRARGLIRSPQVLTQLVILDEPLDVRVVLGCLPGGHRSGAYRGRPFLGCHLRIPLFLGCARTIPGRSARVTPRTGGRTRVFAARCPSARCWTHSACACAASPAWPPGRCRSLRWDRRG